LVTPPAGEQRDLARRVDHDSPDAGGHRVVQLFGCFCVAVQDDLRRRDVRGQGDGQLAARADIHADTLGRDPTGDIDAQ
jgi:hypothetical protein